MVRELHGFAVFDLAMPSTFPCLAQFCTSGVVGGEVVLPSMSQVVLYHHHHHDYANTDACPSHSPNTIDRCEELAITDGVGKWQLQICLSSPVLFASQPFHNCCDQGTGTA
jgi:hypothetical protein